mgnify:CR=1 FL=1
MPAVLLIAKTPLLGRLNPDDLQRLTASGAIDRDRLEAAATAHAACLAATRQLLAGWMVTERRVQDLVPGEDAAVDLVVTVGGDGTVFTANTLRTAAPFLAINSDPERSIGHFTRATAITAAGILAAWQAGRAVLEPIHRLRVSVAGAHWTMLNDCLITNTNPAAMSRYVLDQDGEREHQRSSGVWVATASGSTAAINSAGVAPVPADHPALLFKVREPFHGRWPITLLEGRQLPPRSLRLAPAVPGMALYIDGPNITVPLAPGQVAAFDLSPRPLLLVRG